MREKVPEWAYYSEDRGLQGAHDPELILIVDPIDGTRPAAAGFETACVSIAAVPPLPAPTMGDVVVGVRAGDQERRPVRGREGRRLSACSAPPAPTSPSSRRRPPTWTASSGRSAFAAGPRVILARVLEELIDASSVGGCVFDIGSATYSITRILTGQLDAYVDIGPAIIAAQPWTEAAFRRVGRGNVLCNSPYDLAAVHLLCREAGIPIADADGSSLEARPVLGSDSTYQLACIAAGNERLQAGLVEVVQRGIAGLRRHEHAGATGGHALRPGRGRRGGLPRVPAPLPHQARQGRRVPGPRQPRRHALRRELRARLQRGGRSHREEAAVPLLPGEHRALARAAWAATSPAATARTGRSRAADPAASMRDLRELPVRNLPVLAEHNDCQGVAWTYNEPTIWLEYIFDGAQLAHEHGLYTVMVTNGYITEEALDVLAPSIDAYRVDVKGFSDEQYRGALPHPRHGSRVGRRRARQAQARLSRGDRDQRHPDLQRRRSDAARYRRLDRRRAGAGDALARHALHALSGVRPLAADAHPHAARERCASARTRGSSSCTSATCRATTGENTMCPNCQPLAGAAHRRAVEDVALRGTFCSMCGANVECRTHIK